VTWSETFELNNLTRPPHWTVAPRLALRLSRRVASGAACGPLICCASCVPFCSWPIRRVVREPDYASIDALILHMYEFQNRPNTVYSDCPGCARGGHGSKDHRGSQGRGSGRAAVLRRSIRGVWALHAAGGLLCSSLDFPIETGEAIHDVVGIKAEGATSAHTLSAA